MKVKNLVKLVVFALVVAVLIYTAVSGITVTMPFSGNKYYFPSVLDEEYGINKGLDLVGGSIIAFEADAENPSVSDMDAAEQVIRRRLDDKGYFDATVTRQGDKVIRIEIPNISDPEEAVQTLGATAKLSFTDAEGNVVMEGKTDVSKATYTYGQTSETGNAEHYVTLTLTNEGRKKFAEATAIAAAKTDGNNVIVIKLDETEISRPQVAQKIDSTTCIITGNFTEESAKALANQIQSGQLPFALKEAELRSVGPTLGDKALETSLIAAGIGILLVMLFMLIIYRLPGLIADLSLLCYIALVSLVMAGYLMPGDFKATLTLPGIAGIILSIGMAVDANVIIFERIREELRLGKTVNAAVDSGFHRALSAIIDANITTVIAAGVLWYFGTGSIKGFAFTLFIGVIVSMLTAVFITRYLLRLMVGLDVKNPKLY